MWLPEHFPEGKTIASGIWLSFSVCKRWTKGSNKKSHVEKVIVRTQRFSKKLVSDYRRVIQGFWTEIDEKHLHFLQKRYDGSLTRERHVKFSASQKSITYFKKQLGKNFVLEDFRNTTQFIAIELIYIDDWTARMRQTSLIKKHFCANGMANAISTSSFFCKPDRVDQEAKMLNAERASQYRSIRENLIFFAMMKRLIYVRLWAFWDHLFLGQRYNISQ